ncbi:uncharacterized protein E0L32_011845 [Thyridium curvatum]|uniref:Survival protein SurE-like phosphatase/nucleotidase domain-containing protein n=1 Tax=Thyridium curvatum TaxID=1093900 RepID=A0A507B4L8_9PEZI|nr:uncharacterized protein E0L32_011845 [Thyridium curvatum]TPX18075.1 hypothetical protein E0L32_011845 [Thyridium curvatum]
MHILVTNDDGPPSPHSSPYVHALVRALQAAGHTVSVCLPHTQRSWIGKAHLIGHTVRPTYYRPPTEAASPVPAGLPGATDDGSTHARPWRRSSPGEQAPEEWVLVDGTPASCVQIGLHHFFRERGAVDLVVSGPNYGRNTTAVFALSSGTLGGAIEAAVCRRRAVALSYAFFTRNHDPEVVGAATRHAVRVIERLAAQFPADGSVDVYSVNVPLVEGVDTHRTLWTGMLQNYWSEGGCFQAVEGGDGGDEDEAEERIREGRDGEVAAAAAANGDGGDGGAAAASSQHVHKHFKWAPRFTDVYRSVEEAPPGNDGWAVKEGFTSVTAIKANFWAAATHLHGQELELEPSQKALASRPKPADEKKDPDHIYALIDYEDAYVQPLILSAFEKLLPKERYTLLTPPTPTTESSDCAISLPSLLPSPDAKVLQISPYESIDFEHAATHPATSLVNSYMIRKALIRKHFLSSTVDHWVAKHPDSVLKTHVKRSEAFEVDYAEFLDDALVEAFDLRASLEKNEEGGPEEDEVEEPGETGAVGGGGGLGQGSSSSPSSSSSSSKEWWILKPGMSDRGQGIKLFHTMEELQGIFDAWEEDQPDSDDEDDEDNTSQNGAGGDGDEDDADEGKEYITTSHLRHFVAQPYIHPPLLLPGMQNRKFHVRTYVLCTGAMKVHVFRPMLALFAGKPYAAPWEGGGDDDDGSSNGNLDAHLTNTCLQKEDGSGAAREGAVARFWDLPDLPDGSATATATTTKAAISKESIFAQICDVAGEIFEAAARGMVVHFQPLPGAFEVYGLDFLVDAAGTAWLLEVNAFPDFKQTGDELSEIVAEFWAGVLRLAVGPFAGASASTSTTSSGRDADSDMVLVREVDLGRRVDEPNGIAIFLAMIRRVVVFV